jgi:arylsulfatase A-like enzyme
MLNNLKTIFVVSVAFGLSCSGTCRSKDSPLETVTSIARWPGRIPAGATIDHLFGLTDVLVTIAAVCDKPLPEGQGVDSTNQLAVLLNKTDEITERPALVTASYAGFLSLRQGKWKAVFGTKRTKNKVRRQRTDRAWRTLRASTEKLRQLLKQTNN